MRKEVNGRLTEHIGLCKWLNFHHTSLMAKLYVGGTNRLEKKERLFSNAAVRKLFWDSLHAENWLRFSMTPQAVLVAESHVSLTPNKWRLLLSQLLEIQAYCPPLLHTTEQRASAVSTAKDARQICVLHCFLYLLFLLRKIRRETIGTESRGLDLEFYLCHGESWRKRVLCVCFLPLWESCWGLPDKLCFKPLRY